MRALAAAAVALALLTSGAAQAQAPAPAAPPPQDRFVPAEIRAPVPYETWRGAMLFRMTVAGRPVLAILDTGASSSLIDLKFARDLGLPLEPEPTTLVTGGGGDQPQWSTKAVTVVIPGQFSLNASRLRVGDISVISGHLLRDVHFMLGMDVLRSLVLMVDPGLGEFQVAPSGSLKALRDAQVLDLQSAPLPLVKLSAGGRDFTVVLDTGQAADLCVSPTVWASLAPHLSAVRQAQQIDVLGRVDDVRAAKLSALTLGDATLQDIDVCERALTRLPVDGLAGYSLLSRFRFAIDLAAGKLWLSPRPANDARRDR